MKQCASRHDRGHLRPARHSCSRPCAPQWRSLPARLCPRQASHQQRHDHPHHRSQSKFQQSAQCDNTQALQEVRLAPEPQTGLTWQWQSRIHRRVREPNERRRRMRPAEGPCVQDPSKVLMLRWTLTRGLAIEGPHRGLKVSKMRRRAELQGQTLRMVDETCTRHRHDQNTPHRCMRFGRHRKCALEHQAEKPARLSQRLSTVVSCLYSMRHHGPQP
eukprot:scaffold38203_cov32-Tisochrysis_lutea.AAC.3